MQLAPNTLDIQTFFIRTKVVAQRRINSATFSRIKRINKLNFFATKNNWSSFLPIFKTGALNFGAEKVTSMPPRHPIPSPKIYLEIGSVVTSASCLKYFKTISFRSPNLLITFRPSRQQKILILKATAINKFSWPGVSLINNKLWSINRVAI